MTFYPERFIQGYAIEEFYEFLGVKAVNKEAELECKNFLKNLNVK